MISPPTPSHTQRLELPHCRFPQHRHAVLRRIARALRWRCRCNNAREGVRPFLCLAVLRSHRYGNNVCSIGTVTNSTAGKYLIQYRSSDAACDLMPDAGDGYAGTISSPTVYGAILTSSDRSFQLH
ncbi:hypothetical protein R3P38DRAFT_934751 [Favolaschia claudopus]|uniref:Uncharacterized protein n=1 Tax=Favolaschia claudopus TaxID=2862362 RepID=A0AAW0BRN3_9AGAR